MKTFTSQPMVAAPASSISVAVSQLTIDEGKSNKSKKGSNKEKKGSFQEETKIDQLEKENQEYKARVDALTIENNNLKAKISDLQERVGELANAEWRLRRMEEQERDLYR